jgi:hypothetical protein
MSQPMTETEAPRWHERFAMACNNRAWELAVQVRTPLQDREMLDAAHASAWHWGQIGTELNRMRATMLLAEVHALLGMGPSALALAEEMRGYFLTHECPDWELAFTHAIHAHAAHAAGRRAEYREAYGKAAAALHAIAGEEDRKIVAQTFDRIPPP